MSDLPDFSVRGRMRYARDNQQDLASLARWVVRGFGDGSAEGCARAAIAFWQKALACEDAPGVPTMTKPMRLFAEAELVKQQAALEAALPKIAPRRHDWSPV